MKRFRPFMIATLMSLTSLSIGCAQNGGGATKVVSSMVDTRVALVKAQSDLSATVVALDELSKADGDLTAKYAKFKEAIASTNDQKNRSEERAVSMRQNAAEYQKRWEDETANLNSPNLRASAEQRRAQVREKYDDILTVAGEARQQYAILYTALLDINQYLANDLNPAAVEKAKPTIATARQRGDALNAKLGELVGMINELTAEMTPSGTVPQR